jgi:hypothetical protein
VSVVTFVSDRVLIVLPRAEVRHAAITETDETVAIEVSLSSLAQPIRIELYKSSRSLTMRQRGLDPHTADEMVAALTLAKQMIADLRLVVDTDVTWTPSVHGSQWSRSEGRPTDMSSPGLTCGEYMKPAGSSFPAESYPMCTLARGHAGKHSSMAR